MRTFETARLVIRGFKPDDWKDLQEYISQKDVTKYDYEYPSSDQDCKGIAQCFSTADGFWAICLRDNGKMIGHIVINQKDPKEFLTWHVGFVFNPSYYSKGFATESCRRILEYAFEELGAHRVESACHPDNTAAWKLLERLCMRREAHNVKSTFVRKTSDGKPIWWDSYLYAILDEEWMERKNRELKQ